MTIDEKASDAGWTAWKGSAELSFRERLDAAIAAYEQARERVAFEVTPEEMERFFSEEGPEPSAYRDSMECHAVQLNRILAQRPAPSAQPWTRELAESMVRAYEGQSNAECNETQAEHHYNGACYGKCGKFVSKSAAKPATPDLDLAGRVERLERFARHTLDALKHHEFTEPADEVSIDMALKALEGK